MDISRGSLAAVDISRRFLTAVDISRGSLTGVDISRGCLTAVDISRGSLTGVDISRGCLSAGAGTVGLGELFRLPEWPGAGFSWYCEGRVVFADNMNSILLLERAAESVNSIS